MISPCPKCGATKTDPVPHDFKYNLARAFGYRLQRCSRCRAARFIRLHREKSLGESLVLEEAGSSGWLAEEGESPGTAKARPDPGKDQLTAAGSSDRDVPHCPDCGSTSYHRTRRTTKERMLRRPPMARCERCGKRFPYLRDRAKSLDSLKSGQAVASTSNEGEEGRGLRTAEECAGQGVDKQETAANSSNRESSCCPFCGGTVYRRSRRSTLERLLLRPRMARCSRCRKRFPFPER